MYVRKVREHIKLWARDGVSNVMLWGTSQLKIFGAHYPWMNSGP